MNSHYTYLLIDVLTILFPLAFSFEKKVMFYKQWKYLWVGIVVTGAFFIAWDVLFTQQGVWSFNEKYITGLQLGNLPIEEWLFFIVVPYSCVFIYECVQYYAPALKEQSWGWMVLFAIGFVALVTGLSFSYKAYTFTAFSFCGFGLILLYLFRNKLQAFKASVFVVSYAISLIPFMIVNGFLTALPVVQYNDAENLGVRIYTIPLEDCFYGLLLLAGNTLGMEWMRGRSAKTA